MFNNRPRPAAKQHGTEGCPIADKINTTALTASKPGQKLRYLLKDQMR